MIIGGRKKEVIDNIKYNTENNLLNTKVEVNDPNLTENEQYNLINKYNKNKNKKISSYFKNKIANIIINNINNKLNKNMIITGIENIKDITGGAIITNNHFNPLDSLPIFMLKKKYLKQKLYIVSESANLMLPGILEFLLNNLNVIPLFESTNYIIKSFTPKMLDTLNKGNVILIYPEEEMWFNYKKPRPCKRGAYKYAAEANVPIISCFTEMIETDNDDNEEFKLVKYKLHILKPIYPDKNKSVKENSIIMAEQDYKQKIEMYEKCYNKKLNYEFSYDDIAGYKNKD